LRAGEKSPASVTKHRAITLALQPATPLLYQYPHNSNATVTLPSDVKSPAIKRY